MKQKIKFWILVAVVAMLCSACSTDNNSGQGQGEATKPPPQVRVETLPTLTPEPMLATETVVEPTAELNAAAQSNVWQAQTPDIEAQADSIEADMDAIDNQLKNQKFILKP
jgi:hypothetical protein